MLSKNLRLLFLNFKFMDISPKNTENCMTRKGCLKLLKHSVRNSSNIIKQDENRLQSENFCQFGDYKTAFELKTTKDIVRSLAVLKITSFDSIVNNAEKLIITGRRILTQPVFDYFIKKSFYKQFVAGEDAMEIKDCVCTLKKAGISTMLAVPIEEDVTDENRKMYDKNLETLVDCYKLSSRLHIECPIMQLKMSAICSAPLLVKIGTLYPNPVRNYHIVDMIVKGLTTESKVYLKGLTEEETIELNEVIRRMKVIGKVAEESGVISMMDAEYTYLNDAIRLFILSLMLVHNKHKPLMCYTYQNYLKMTFGALKEDVEFVLSRNRHFGCKLVRGAYMCKERELAQKMGYADPVHDNYENTSTMYIQSAEFLLNKLAENRKCMVMVATHNEDAINHIIDKSRSLNITASDGKLYFAQLLGMCDHVSFTLGKAGYPVYKSLPYGNIDDTIPYLIRRAQENRAVLSGARRERQLLTKALWHRCLKTPKIVTHTEDIQNRSQF